jgi:hypothetical membrane protein
MDKIKMEQVFLGMGIAFWLIYLLNLIVLGAISPGYSHMRHQVSHLGTVDFPYHYIFNTVIILSGLLLIPTGMGFYYSVKRIAGRKVLAFVIGILVGISSIGCFFAGFYPLPDPRHGGYGIGTILFLAPPFLTWAFWKIRGTRFLILYQFISFILMIITFLILTGVGGLINGLNAGLFQRLFILIGIFWFTYTCYWLIRYKPEKITCVS